VAQQLLRQEQYTNGIVLGQLQSDDNDGTTITATATATATSTASKYQKKTLQGE
jgi:hypothetical protein